MCQIDQLIHHVGKYPLGMCCIQFFSSRFVYIYIYILCIFCHCSIYVSSDIPFAYQLRFVDKLILYSYYLLCFFVLMRLFGEIKIKIYIYERIQMSNYNHSDTTVAFNH